MEETDVITSSTQIFIPEDCTQWDDVNDENDDDDEKDLPCCPICSYVWEKEGIVEREAHVENCLAKVEPNHQQRVACPICTATFSTVHEVEMHVDICTGSFSNKEPKNNTGEEDDISTCPICKIGLPQSVTKRVKHIKICASNTNVHGPKDLAVEECDDLLALLIEEAERQDPRRDKLVQTETIVENVKENLTENSIPDLVKITNFFPITLQSLSKRPKSSLPDLPAEPDRPWYSCPSWKRIPDSSIVVDAFQYAHPQLTNIYILSHFHYDHYIGLTKAFNAGIIYCSGTTARLVISVLKVNRSRIRVLEVGKSSRLDDGTIVTPFDANHAPGSCVFVFETKSGKLFVHTGDFRANDSLAAKVRQLSFRVSRPIESLFLDTTYCDEGYDFLPQSKVIEMCRDAVVSHLVRIPKTLVVFGAYTIGKERIALTCAGQSRLAVSKKKMGIVKCCSSEFSLAEMSCFTTNRSITNFWMVTMAELDVKRLEKLRQQYSARFQHVLGIRPTGWVKSFKVVKESPSVTTMFVPYSEHSSFGELKRFVAQTNPRSVVPTVMAKGRSKEDMLRTLLY